MKDLLRFAIALIVSVVISLIVLEATEFDTLKSQTAAQNARRHAAMQPALDMCHRAPTHPECVELIEAITGLEVVADGLALRVGP